MDNELDLSKSPTAFTLTAVESGQYQIEITSIDPKGQALVEAGRERLTVLVKRGVLRFRVFEYNEFVWKKSLMLLKLKLSVWLIIGLLISGAGLNLVAAQTPGQANDVVVSLTTAANEASAAISESDAVQLKLTLSSALSHALPVNLSYAGEVAGSADPNTVIVPDGQTEYVFGASLDDQIAAQPLRDIRISVAAGDYDVSEVSSEVAVMVTDDDSVALSLVPVRETILEGEDAVFRAVLDRETATAVSAEIEFIANGGFFLTLLENEMVTFPAGQTSLLITIETDDDERLETDGTLVAMIVSAEAPLLIGASQLSTIQIRDNDLAVSIVTFPDEESSIEVAEDVGNITLRVDVNRVLGEALPITLKYTGDRGAITGEPSSAGTPDLLFNLTIPAGRSSSIIDVLVIDDSIAGEFTRTARVELVDLGTYVVSPASSAVEIAVLDDSDFVTVSVMPLSSMVTEGESVQFQVTQDLVTDTPSSVDLMVTRMGDFFSRESFPNSIYNDARAGVALELGTVSGISLSLRAPVITDDGKVYYFLDRPNDAVNGLQYTHDALDILLNNGDDTIDTQADGHDGSDDERSVIVGDYTLILPTEEEYETLYEQFGISTGWASDGNSARYCPSTRSDDPNFERFFLFNNGRIGTVQTTFFGFMITTECFVVFQVRDAPEVITVELPAGEMSSFTLEIQTVDDSVADINGSVFVQLITREGSPLRPVGPPGDRAMIEIHDNDITTVRIAPVSDTVGEGESLVFDLSREVPEEGELLATDIDLQFTAQGNFFASTPVAIQAAFGLPLNLGTDAASNIPLNLIHPITLEDGKVYYILDQDGDGIITDADRVQNGALDTLLNAGSRVRGTQYRGHLGNDDERSVVVGDYTLVLPTGDPIGAARSEGQEYRAINDQFDGAPALWRNGQSGSFRYCTATTNLLNNVLAYSYFNLTDNANSLIISSSTSSGLCFAAFQVLDAGLTVHFPAAVASTRVVIPTVDDATAEADGLLSASVITRGLAVQIADSGTAPVATVTIQDDDFMIISINVADHLTEGETAVFEVIHSLPEGSENTERSIELTITTEGDFFPVPYLSESLEFSDVLGGTTLLLPITVDGVRYYFLDVNQDGVADENDEITHAQLDTLLNEGADTQKTQAEIVLADGSRRYVGHDGSDDERSVIIDGYTLVLPIKEQYTRLAEAYREYRNNRDDWPWPLFSHCSAEPGSNSDSHLQYTINSNVTGEPLVETEAVDSDFCYAVFEVVNRSGFTLSEGDDRFSVSIETTDDAAAEPNGLISVVAYSKDPLMIRGSVGSALDRGTVVVQDNDDRNVGITAPDGTLRINAMEGNTVNLQVNVMPVFQQATIVRLSYDDTSGALSEGASTMVTVAADTASSAFNISLNEDMLTAQSDQSILVSVLQGTGYRANTSVVEIIRQDNDFAEINLSARVPEIIEGNPAVFDVSLSLVPAEAVEVGITYDANGNFFAGNQALQVLSATAAFAEGETSVRLEVMTEDDTTTELPGDISATITPESVPDSLRLGTQASAMVAILDDDVMVSIVTPEGESSVELTEDNDRTTLQFSMTSQFANNVQVNLRYEGGTGVSPSSVIVPANESSFKFSISGLDNMIAAQGIYDIDVCLDAGIAYTIAPTQECVRLTVTDNDTATASISPLKEAITEGDDAVFEITSDLDVSTPVSVKVDFVSDGDFFSTSPDGMSTTVVIFPENRNTRLVIPTINDIDSEDNGFLVATLSRLPDSPLLVGMPRQSTITILDNESVVSITTLDGAATATLDENTVTTLLLTIEPVAVREFQVNLGYDGRDDLLPRVVTVPANSATHAFSITGLDDRIAAQGDYAVDVFVADGLGYQIQSGEDRVTLTISDNDTATVSVSPLRDMILEGEDAVFELTLSTEMAIDASVTLSFMFINDPTQAVPDQVLTFTAGETTAQAVILTDDNNLIEDNSLLVANIVTVSSALLVGNARSMITITENDVDVSVTAMDGSDRILIMESERAVGLMLHIDPPVDYALAVNIVLTGDPGALTGAFSADDTADITRLIEVPADVSAHPFELEVVDDFIAAESTRTAEIVVAPGSYEVVGNPVRVDVLDNDIATVSLSRSVTTLIEGDTLLLDIVQDLPTDVATSVVLTFKPIGDFYQPALKPEQLDLGFHQASSLNLSLIFPADVIAKQDSSVGSAVYYFLDQNGDGSATIEDTVIMPQLGALLNPGSLPVETGRLASRHEGNDNGRSAVVGDYTLALEEGGVGSGGDIAAVYHPEWPESDLVRTTGRGAPHYCTAQRQSNIDRFLQQYDGFYIFEVVSYVNLPGQDPTSLERVLNPPRAFDNRVVWDPCLVIFEVINRVVVHFPAGVVQATTQVAIETIDDAEAELDGEFQAQLLEARADSPSQFQFEPRGVVRTPVLDNDRVVSLTLATGSTSALTEMVGGFESSSMVVTLSSPNNAQDVRVNLGYTGNVGFLGAESVSFVDIPAGMTAHTFTVPFVNDKVALQAIQTTISVSIEAGDGYVVSDTLNTIEMSITDTDIAAVSIVPVTDVITESEAAVFEITHDLGIATAATIQLDIVTAGEFFANDLSSPMTIDIPVGVAGSTQQLTIPLVSDDVAEVHGSLQATLSGVNSQLVPGSTGSATITILDDDIPTITIVSVSDTIAEGESIVIDLALNVPQESSVMFNIGIVAATGGDFLAENDVGNVLTESFGANSTERQVEISTLDDAVMEMDGTVTLEFTSANDVSGLPQARFAGVYGATPTPRRTVTILDNETRVSLTTLDDESAQTVMATDDATTLVLTLNTPYPETFQVDLRYTGSDGLTLSPSVVTIPANSASVAFSVSGLDDGLVAQAQPTRTIEVSVLDGVFHAASSALRTVVLTVVHDSIATVGILPVMSTVTEGKPALFEVSLERGAGTDIEIGIDISLGGDFIAAQSRGRTTVTVPAGQMSAILTVPTLDNMNTDADSLLVATIAQVPHPALRIAMPFSATVTILDNASVVGLTTLTGSDNQRLAEADGDSTTLRLTISPPAQRQLQVNLGYAADGFLPATVTVPPGLTQYDFSISGIDDMFSGLMPRRNVDVFVTEGLGYSVSPADTTVRLTIAEGDIVTLRILPVREIIGEGDDAVFAVSLNVAAETDVSARLSFMTTGDFMAAVPADTEVVFAAGETSLLLTFATLDDAETEPAGSLSVQVVMQVAGQALGVPVTSTITILDNESVVSLQQNSVHSNMVSESRGAATLRLRIDPPVPRDLAVNLRYTGDTGALTGTIESVGDVTQRVMVPADTRFHVFDIEIVDDQIAGELTRQLQLSVDPGPGYTPADTILPLTITDDEIVRFSVVSVRSRITNGDNAVFEITQDVATVGTMFVMLKLEGNTGFPAVPPVLNHGTVDGVNLNLILPVSAPFGTVYFVDHNGNGVADIGDQVRIRALQALLNNGNHLTQTQDRNHDGSDDQRSVIINGTTFIVPTSNEFQGLVYGMQTSNGQPPGWYGERGAPYCLAERRDSMSPSLADVFEFIGGMGGDTQIGRDLSCFVAFQVLNPGVSVDTSAGVAYAHDRPEGTFVIVYIPAGEALSRTQLSIPTDGTVAGDTSVTATLQAIYDFPLPIGDRTPGFDAVFLDRDNSPVAIGSPDSAVVMLLDNQVTVDIDVPGGGNTIRVSEGDGSVTLQLNINPPVQFPLSLNLAYSGDTDAFTGAFSTPDPQSVMVVIEALTNTASASFTIPIVDDEFAEYDRSVNVSLMPGVGYTPSTDVVAITVTDNDSNEVNLARTGGTITEGDLIVFEVSKYPIADVETSVVLSFTQEGDFFESLPSSRVFTFPARSLFSSDRWKIRTHDDAVIENDGSLVATLSVPSSQRALLEIGDRAQRTITIQDNDSLVSITSVSGDTTVRVVENAGAIPLQISVNPTVSRSLDVAIGYTGDLDGISAGFTEDMVITVPADRSTYQFNIPLMDDVVAEFTDFVTVNVEAGTDYAASASTVGITIENDDFTEASIALLSDEVITEGETIQFEITQNLAVEVETSIDLILMPMGDFFDELSSGVSKTITLNFPAGVADNTTRVSIQTVRDEDLELTGSLSAMIKVSDDMASQTLVRIVAAEGTSTVTILDNTIPVSVIPPSLEIVTGMNEDLAIEVNADTDVSIRIMSDDSNIASVSESDITVAGSGIRRTTITVTGGIVDRTSLTIEASAAGFSPSIVRVPVQVLGLLRIQVVPEMVTLMEGEGESTKIKVSLNRIEDGSVVQITTIPDDLNDIGLEMISLTELEFTDTNPREITVDSLINPIYVGDRDVEFVLTADKYQSATVRVTIIEDQLPPVGLIVTPSTEEFVVEGTWPLTIAVSESTDASITVRSDSTAIASVSESAAAFTLTRDGDSSTTIDIIGNAIGVTTLTITASADGYADETRTVDVDVLSRFRVIAVPDMFNLVEGTDRQIEVRLSLIEENTGPITVGIVATGDIRVTDGTNLSSNLTFTTTATQTVTVEAIDDEGYEAGRTAIVTLTAEGYTTEIVIVNIIEDERLITLDIDGETSTTLTLLRFEQTPLTVQVDSSDGSLSGVVLNVATTGEVTLADGSKSTRLDLAGGAAQDQQIAISGSNIGAGTVTFMAGGAKVVSNLAVVNVTVSTPTLVISQVSNNDIMLETRETTDVRFVVDVARDPDNLTLTAEVSEGENVLTVTQPVISNSAFIFAVGSGIEAGNATVTLTAMHPDYNSESTEIAVSVSLRQIGLSVSSSPLNIGLGGSRELRIQVTARVATQATLTASVADGSIISLTGAEMPISLIGNQLAGEATTITVNGDSLGTRNLEIRVEADGYETAIRTIAVTVTKISDLRFRIKVFLEGAQ